MSDEPIRIGHADRPGATDGTGVGGSHGADCDCCAGTALSTVVPIENRANLTDVSYRAGDHGQFKASMLTSLASTNYSQLAGLRTRADDDFSIALIDAWASACDVLSFYQERHANEAFIQTARERLSVGEIARLIGYRLHPGSAAEASLVFLMDDPPGVEPTVAELTIPSGTSVQSQPGPDEMPQIFETLDDLVAKVAWNRFAARSSRPIPLTAGATGAWLEGQATSLAIGDAVVVVGRERSDVTFADFDAASPLWAFRRIASVEPSVDLDRTRVEWDVPLTDVGESAQLFVLGQRASLFGFSAPHPLVLSAVQREDFGYRGDASELAEAAFAKTTATVPQSPSVIDGDEDNPGDWVFRLTNGRLPLDSSYKGFVAGGWVVGALPDDTLGLYRIESVADRAFARYAVSGKSTELRVDSSTNFTAFRGDYRNVTAYGASVELDQAEVPIEGWVGGAEIELAGLVDDLPEGRRMIATGRRAQVIVMADGLVIAGVDGEDRELEPGTRLTLLGEPKMRVFFFVGIASTALIGLGFGSGFISGGLGFAGINFVGSGDLLFDGGGGGGGGGSGGGQSAADDFAFDDGEDDDDGGGGGSSPTGTHEWEVRDADGFEGTVIADLDELQAIVADESAEVIAEVIELDRIEAADTTHSILVLAQSLTSVYDRTDFGIHANIAVASHGASVTEILGGGEPGRPFQSHRLKQGPVTHLIAPTESGVSSTLEVRVDGVRWDEVTDLYERDPNGRVFATSLSDEGTTTVHFGDGDSGARPAPGRDNIVASARVGLGRDGNVRAGQLSVALDQPLGLREVTNPLPALGGADAERLEDARRNAPIYTLTLGRLVSLTDYRDFALGYPGIAKADAGWVWSGESRRIVVTIAGADGAVIEANGPVHEALLAAYRTLGDPFVQFDLLSYEPVEFRVAMRVAVDPAYVSADVLTGVDTMLRNEFAFEQRDFGQPVAASEVVAAAHGVDGVAAIDLDRLYRTVAPQATPELNDLVAARPGRSSAGLLQPAELLTLSAEPLDALEVM